MENLLSQGEIVSTPSVLCFPERKESVCPSRLLLDERVQGQMWESKNNTGRGGSPIWYLGSFLFFFFFLLDNAGVYFNTFQHYSDAGIYWLNTVYSVRLFISKCKLLTLTSWWFMLIICPERNKCPPWEVLPSLLYGIVRHQSSELTAACLWRNSDTVTILL